MQVMHNGCQSSGPLQLLTHLKSKWAGNRDAPHLHSAACATGGHWRVGPLRPARAAGKTPAARARPARPPPPPPPSTRTGPGASSNAKHASPPMKEGQDVAIRGSQGHGLSIASRSFKASL